MMSQLEEKMLFCSPDLSSTSGLIYSQIIMPQPAQENISRKMMRRRRRKKTKTDQDGLGGDDHQAKKRRLTDAQLKFLETNFGEERKLESGRKVSLASELGLDPKQVAVWFQNRRARWKNKQLEDEHRKLKSQLAASAINKHHLQNENEKLKKRLSEREEEIKMLSGRLQNVGLTGGSPPNSSSTFSTDNTFQYPSSYLGEFGMKGDHDQLMYANDDQYTFANYIMDCEDWGYIHLL